MKTARRRWIAFEGVKNRLLQITREFKTQLSIYNAAIRHPRTPRLARWLLVAAIAYLASPIDLIPDFIPVLGHLDDLIIIPALVALAVRLIPQDVLAECCFVERTTGGEGWIDFFHRNLEQPQWESALAFIHETNERFLSSPRPHHIFSRARLNWRSRRVTFPSRCANVVAYGSACAPPC